MISYDPLFETLSEKGLSLNDLAQGCNINTRVRAKFRKNERVSLETIERICEFLNVPIEKVVKVDYK